MFFSFWNIILSCYFIKMFYLFLGWNSNKYLCMRFTIKSKILDPDISLKLCLQFLNDYGVL